MQCRYTKIAQRIFKYSDIQYTSLTPDKILNSLVYRTLFYVNIYGSHKLLKQSGFFGPPCIYMAAGLELRLLKMEVRKCHIRNSRTEGDKAAELSDCGLS